ncbi:hypothetical protein BDF14DRAFT_1726232 [Spinellus fusiger]|nr:hypothetical protein BDF14DRAFT_1726232 [Spinellus fusiger]
MTARGNKPSVYFENEYDTSNKWAPTSKSIHIDNCIREPPIANKFIHEYFENGPNHATEKEMEDESTQLNIHEQCTSTLHKHRYWTDRIIDDIAGLIHVLSPLGEVLYCSESWTDLTGYYPHELIGQPFANFIHIDDLDIFIRDFNLVFHRRAQMKTHFRLRKKDDTYILLESVSQLKSNSEEKNVQNVFSIATPYMTSLSSSIDSFIDLKMENEWLKQRLKEVAACEKSEFVIPCPKSISVNCKSEEKFELRQAPIQLLEERRLWPKASSLPLKESGSPESIAYHPTESSYTGHLSDFFGDTFERKKKWKRQASTKIRRVEEYICTDCGTANSPEWRKGPQGPKTLCNACGLRWAKKNKSYLKTDYT